MISGEEMEVELIGDLEIVCHCNEEIVVALRDVAYVPRLSVELISINREFRITLPRSSESQRLADVTGILDYQAKTP